MNSYFKEIDFRKTNYCKKCFQKKKKFCKATKLRYFTGIHFCDIRILKNKHYIESLLVFSKHQISSSNFNKYRQNGYTWNLKKFNSPFVSISIFRKGLLLEKNLIFAGISFCKFFKKSRNFWKLIPVKPK